MSLHLHRTDIYAPMSVTLYMKYLFYIFSGVRVPVIPFQVTHLSCHVELVEIILEHEETKTKSIFQFRKLSCVRPVFKVGLCNY